MFISLARLFLVSVVASLAAMSQAATIVAEQIDGKIVVHVSGSIEPGDENEFRRLSLEYSDALVVLTSSGGHLAPAIEIGKMIRLAGYDTVVVSEAECASSCALIWVAGQRRWMAENARVGFHASYRKENGLPVESGVANAMIGHYLTTLGFGPDAILFATSAGPSDIRWLDKAAADATGLYFRRIPAEWTKRLASRSQSLPLPPPMPPAIKKSRPAGPQEAPATSDYETVALHWLWGHQGAVEIYTVDRPASRKRYLVAAPQGVDAGDLTTLVTLYDAGGNWIAYTYTADSISLFDADRVYRAGPDVFVWVSDPEGELEAQSLLKLSCEKGTWGLVEGLLVDADGSVHSRFDFRADFETRPVRTDTNAHDLLKTVCWK